MGNAGGAGTPWACDLRGFCSGVSGSQAHRGRALLPSGPLARAARPGAPILGYRLYRCLTGAVWAASLQRAWVWGDPVHSYSACESILKRFEALPCSIQGKVIEISDRCPCLVWWLLAMHG